MRWESRVLRKPASSRGISGSSRLSASSVTKNDHSIELSCPQNRTARRVESKTRLRFGKLSMTSRVSSVGAGNPAFSQAFGIPHPPIISLQVAPGDVEGFEMSLNRGQGFLAGGVPAADL